MIQHDGTVGISSDLLCMKSLYNSLEYTTRYLRRHYFFIILNLSTSSKHTNDLVLLNNLEQINVIDYTSVACAYSVFGIWIFSYGNFTIDLQKPFDETQIMYENNTSVTRRHNKNSNITFSFDYISRDYNAQIPFYEKYIREYRDFYNFSNIIPDMRLDTYLKIPMCTQSLYNLAQYNSYINENFVIVLNLKAYDYTNNLIHYYYKSVRCGDTVFGVWIFKCGGQFLVKSYNDRIRKDFLVDKSCEIDPKSVKKYVINYNKIMFTLNQNVRTSMDDAKNIIIDFNNENCPRNNFTNNYNYHEYYFNCSKVTNN